jgi:hypothetical protein
LNVPPGCTVTVRQRTGSINDSVIFDRSSSLEISPASTPSGIRTKQRTVEELTGEPSEDDVAHLRVVLVLGASLHEPPLRDGLIRDQFLLEGARVPRDAGVESLLELHGGCANGGAY